MAAATAPAPSLLTPEGQKQFRSTLEQEQLLQRHLDQSDAECHCPDLMLRGAALTPYRVAVPACSLSHELKDPVLSCARVQGHH